MEVDCILAIPPPLPPPARDAPASQENARTELLWIAAEQQRKRRLSEGSSTWNHNEFQACSALICYSLFQGTMFDPSTGSTPLTIARWVLIRTEKKESCPQQQYYEIPQLPCEKGLITLQYRWYCSNLFC